MAGNKPEEAGVRGRDLNTQTLETAASAQAFAFPPRWRLIRPLGRGGQAEVWLALDREVDQMVAIKVFGSDLSADAIRRFRCEVLLGRTLEHSHLVRIFDLIEAGDHLAIAMEWCPHGSLADAHGSQPFSLTDVISIAEQVLDVLAYLHAQGLVHRDIKPSNMLVGADGMVHLGDLGLARRFAGEDDRTRTRTAVGTPTYMSPEQILGHDPGPPSDLYSLGVALFQLLAGRLPFDGNSDFETADHQLHTRAPNPRAIRRDCPRWLARFVLRLMEKSPRDRWPDAGAALAAFRRRRLLASPRLLRRSAVLAGTLALAFGGIEALAPRMAELRAPRVERILSEGRHVRALDGKGKILWDYACRSQIRQVVRAHLRKGKGRQVIVVTAPTLGGAVRLKTPQRASVVLLSKDGVLLSEFLPEEDVLAHCGPLIAPPLLVPRAVPADLDGDGLQEILLTCHHRTLGTAYLFVYWPRQDAWRLVLNHAGGWIFNIASASRMGAARLRFFAFNGILASEEVIGELSLPPPDASARTEGSACIPGAQPMDGARLIWYTPLGQAFPGPAEGENGFICGSDGVSDIRSQGRRWSIDRWGNPIPGPNAGRDLAEARVELLRQLGRLQGSPLPAGRAAIARRSRSLLKRFAPLLAEPPTRAIFALMLARAYARNGAYQDAETVLARAWNEQHNDDLGLYLAHIEAIAGHLDDATITLRKTIQTAVTPAGIFRAPQLLFYLAIEMKDPKLLHEAAALSRDFAHNWELMNVIEARARLWWNRPTASDTSLQSYDLAPAGEAIACLARWRRGTVAPDDPAAMTSAIAENPDAVVEGLLARAVAKTNLGKPARGLADLNEAERRLAGSAAYDFRSFQLLQLAKACRAKVLLAAGRETEAASLARSLLPGLRPGLLPRVVAEEVLAAVARGRKTTARPAGRRPKKNRGVSGGLMAPHLSGAGELRVGR